MIVYLGRCRSQARLKGNIVVVNIFYEGRAQCQCACDCTPGGADQRPLISELKSLDIRPKNSHAEGIKGSSSTLPIRRRFFANSKRAVHEIN